MIDVQPPILMQFIWEAIYSKTSDRKSIGVKAYNYGLHTTYATSPLWPS